MFVLCCCCFALLLCFAVLLLFAYLCEIQLRFFSVAGPAAFPAGSLIQVLQALALGEGVAAAGEAAGARDESAALAAERLWLLNFSDVGSVGLFRLRDPSATGATGNKQQQQQHAKEREQPETEMWEQRK